MLLGDDIPKKTFKSNEQAYNTVEIYFLEHLRSKYCLPKKQQAEKDLKIHLRTYKINLKEIKLKVLKQRIDEIFSEKDLSSSELQSLLGIGIYNYLDDLGFRSFSHLRFSYTKKMTRRKFVTREEALVAFQSKVKEKLLKGTYKCKDDVSLELGTNPQTYSINWKSSVLYPVYDEILENEVKLNPRIGDRELRRKYSFAQGFLNQKGVLKEYKRKKGMIYRAHKNREELLKNCVRAFQMLVEKKEGISRKNIQNMVGACLQNWNINMSDIYEKAEHESVARINREIIEFMYSHDTTSSSKITEHLFEECPELLEQYERPGLLIKTLLHWLSRVNLLFYQKDEGYSSGHFTGIVDYLKKKMIPVRLYKESEVLGFIGTSTQEVKIPEYLLTAEWQSRFFNNLKSVGILKEIKLDHERFYNLERSFFKKYNIL